MTGLASDCSGPTGATPVVFPHAGITGRTMRDPQWQDLTREHDVLRLDLRGLVSRTRARSRSGHTTGPGSKR
jgi:hypothetical protein